MLSHWIWLAERREVKCRTKWELLQHFSDAEDIYLADSEALEAAGLSEQVRTALLDKDLTDAERILEDCRKDRIQVVTIRDAAYPRRLKNIFDPPVVLYYKGTLPEIDSLPAIGIVGTRHPSAYGTQVAKRMGFEIASCGGLVVSGMAGGVDAAAMNSALLAGQPVVGVLGCGPEQIYPKSNRELFGKTERNGCILSEYAPGTMPAKWTFPRRNRIISGLSCGIVVVEAPEKSGSLITARHANEQGRDVFVVPGNVDAAGFVGSNRLLRSGAIAVSRGWDVISEYEHLFPGKISKAEDAEMQMPAEPEKALAQPAEKPEKVSKPERRGKETQKINIDNKTAEPYIDVNDFLKGLTEDEKSVVQAIRQPEELVDAVMERLDMFPGKVLALLTILELKGKVVRLPGRRVSLRKR